MDSYWMERAAALHEELSRTRRKVRELERAYSALRFIAIAGWLVAIGMWVLGSLK